VREEVNEILSEGKRKKRDNFFFIIIFKEIILAIISQKIF